MTSKARAVRIQNPAGGSGYTSRKSAEHLVSRGRARWLDISTIAMVESDPRHQAAERCARSCHEYDRAAHSGIASVEAIRNLPVAGPAERLLTERRRGMAA